MNSVGFLCIQTHMQVHAHTYTHLCVCMRIYVYIKSRKKSIGVEVMWEKLEEGRGKGGDDGNTVLTYKIKIKQINKEI